MTTRLEKIRAAKAAIAAKIGDIVEENFDSAGAILETPGTFTALLEAYKACEIAELSDTADERAKDAADYREGVLRNLGEPDTR
ncbi:hypothetical protein AB4Z25_25005 [Rhizobium sp. RAF36]|uniref:hypothetical protein n=1 Tax=Rhizobium sp. RAF36 TaxID=3233055 RepID=UPI003F953EF9